MSDRGRVLLVDDNDVNVELMAFVLERGGFDVVAVRDAESALIALGERFFDIVVADIQLPAMSGLELARRIKADAATRSLPVVAVTAYAMKGDEGRILAAGCDGYLAKPIDVATFAASVAGFMRAHRAGDRPRR